MLQRAAIFAAIILTMLGLSARPARAQIAFYTDSDGRKVFINGNPAPAPKAHSAAPASAPQPAPALAAAPATPPAADPSAPASDASNSAASSTPENAADSAAAGTAAQTPAAHPRSLDQMVHEVASKYNVDPELIRAVVGAESNWNPHAVSRVGAQGLMQLEPDTARLLGVRDAFDPQQNLDAGVRYLRSLLVRYGGDLDKALAAYNAGPGAVDRAGGVPHIAETRNYVQRVTTDYYRPGAIRAPSAAMEFSRPIYRETDDAGHVVFTNE